VTGAAALDGSVGLQGVVDDVAPLYVQDDSPRDERRLRARFQLDTSGFDAGEAQKPPSHTTGLPPSGSGRARVDGVRP
jgi:hypothetical protein